MKTQAQKTPAAGTAAGPIPGTRTSEAYIRQIAGLAYFWAWPMVNVYNRFLTYQKLPGPGLAGGALPVAPPNQLCMLHDYITPDERAVACPNQDVVYGQMVLDLDADSVVIQVPDFGDRFYVYQIVDQRTDGFGEIGKMYGTKPGFYMFAGSKWDGKTPKGINAVFQCPTRHGMVIPRAFMNNTDDDRKAIQPVINQIAAYPLSQFDGKMKITNWVDAQVFPAGDSGSGEVKWVKPELLFSQLGDVLDAVPPLPGEEGLYQQFRALLDLAKADVKVKAILDDVAVSAENDVVGPLLQFRNYGVPLPANWTTQNNGAQFGTDYYTRTAVAKSNILVNKPTETKYFYQDLDADGNRLNGKNNYTFTLAKGQAPPVNGFWSLTLYNEHHFFHPNDLKRYSLGTKNHDSVKANSDGSVTLYIGANSPGADKESNWLTAPDGDFSLYVRSYWPKKEILDGKWTPPAVEKQK